MIKTNTVDNEEMLTYREKCLLYLLLGRTLTKEDMDILLADVDINKANQNFLLMLSRVGYLQGWDLFPKEIIPCLEGVHRYAQVLNTIRIPWLMEKIRMLRRAGIPVMLIKGLALRFYYSMGMPRMMVDYDIVVPELMYEKAMKVLHEPGEKYWESSYHGVICGDIRHLEVHRWIFKNHGEEKTDIWERAVHFNLYGEEVCVPCPLDMFIHQLDNRSRDMFSADSPNRRINWLYDCRHILDSSGIKLDITVLASRAKELHVQYSARRMLLLFADVFPDVISADEVEKEFPLTSVYEQWLESGYACLSIRSGFEYQYAMTPIHIFRTLKWKYYLYRHLRYETPYLHFWRFLVNDLGIDGVLGFFRKYGNRLCMSAKSKHYG